MDAYQLFIDGDFVDALSGETFESIDPGTGAVIARVARAGAADAEAAIAAARRAFDHGEWSGLAPEARARKCYDFADQIAAQGIRLAVMESMDSGQIIGLSKFWGMLASGTLRNLGYYAATKFPWEEEIPFSGNVFAPAREYIRREPIGVCVGIIPWNFPISMASWKIAHAIIMGTNQVPVSWSPARSTMSSSSACASALRSCGWVTSSSRVHIRDRWSAPTNWRPSRAMSGSESTRALNSSPAVHDSSHRVSRAASTTRRQSSRTCATTCASPRKRSSGRWSVSSGSTRMKKQSPSPTTPCTGWRAASSRTTMPGPSG